MKLGENLYLYINWANPIEEFTLGIHNERTLAVNTGDVEDPNNITEEDFKEANRFILGFLFFNITLVY